MPAKSTSLPEEDYLAILGAIARFHHCLTRDDLLKVLGNVLLPLFKAQSGFYTYTDRKFSQSDGLIGHVGIPDNEIGVFLKTAPITSFNKAMFAQARPVFAHDVDIKRETIEKDFALFFAANPQYTRTDYPYFARVKSGLVAADIPDPTLAVALHRLDDNDGPWTLRDVRVMELLCPHLLQTIRNVCISEELARFQTLCEALANVPTPTALVSGNMTVIFHNQAFKDAFGVEGGQRLPQDLIDLLARETAKYDPPYKAEDGGIELPFYTMGREKFRLSLVLVGEGGEDADKRWLVRMKPAVEPYARTNLWAQEKGITGRELEICMLVKDGKENGEIAGRLFISPHTVKTHLRSIFAKAGVNTRAKLMAALNRAWDSGNA